MAGKEALELGLLMGTENMTPQEEEQDVFSFHTSPPPRVYGCNLHCSIGSGKMINDLIL